MDDENVRLTGEDSSVHGKEIPSCLSENNAEMIFVIDPDEE